MCGLWLQGSLVCLHLVLSRRVMASSVVGMVYWHSCVSSLLFQLLREVLLRFGQRKCEQLHGRACYKYKRAREQGRFIHSSWVYGDGESRAYASLRR